MRHHCIQKSTILLNVLVVLLAVRCEAQTHSVTARPTAKPRATATQARPTVAAPKGSTTSQATQGCVPAPAGLVGWWSGDGNAKDRMSRNNGDTLQSMTYVPGKVGRAFNFDGKSQFVRVPASTTFNTDNGLTIEGWVNPADDSLYPLVDWNSDGRMGAHLWVYDGIGRLFLNLVDVKGTSHGLTSGPGILKANIFQHVAATYDARSGIAILYRNGVVMAESNIGKFKPQTGHDLYLGYHPGSEYKFKGAMDEVSVYNRALTLYEIQSIANAGSAGKCYAGAAPTKAVMPPTPPLHNTLPSALPTVPPIVATPPGTTPIAQPVIPEQQAQDRVVVNLPAPVEDVVVGKGGQYLILWLKRLQKLAIFDTREKQIVKYLSVPAEDVRLAAGADKLIIVLNDQSIMQRWDLRTFERELTVPAPEGGPVHSMAMGYASNGPLLIVNGPIGFYDPHTLNRLDIKFRPDLVMGWNSNVRNPIQLRASGDGSTFTAWHGERSSHGFTTLRINGRTAEDGAKRSDAAYVAPNFDGTMFYHHPLNAELKEVAPGRFGDVNFVPVYGGGFFLAITDKGSGRDRTQNKLTVSVYSETDIKLLVTLPEMEEMAWPGYPRSGMTLDKRIHAMPDAQLMITIPDSKDRLVLRRFDLVEELGQAGIDYLYVNSRPARIALKGQRFVYQLDVKSKRGNVQYSLESGAPGMTLSKTGKLEWGVPAHYQGKEESIIISIRDASGQELFHTFKIAVQ